MANISFVNVTVLPAAPAFIFPKLVVAFPTVPSIIEFPFSVKSPVPVIVEVTFEPSVIIKLESICVLTAFTFPAIVVLYPVFDTSKLAIFPTVPVIV